jgi:PadR family transcriptional regulator PadR
MENSKNTSRDLFSGALEMMDLESLRRQPAHGYALVQHIQQRSNNLLQVEEGSLYPACSGSSKRRWSKAAPQNEDGQSRVDSFAPRRVVVFAST